MKGIYNIAGSDILSRFDFAMKVCEVFGYNKEHQTNNYSESESAARDL
ncbi:MAG: hypothetical protein IPL16_15470 [Ignavibacteria bacterium]|nr:hypothetical protein [Ignavibacteria bacterium]